MLGAMVQGVFPCLDGAHILWSLSLGATALTRSPEVHSLLVRLLDGQTGGPELLGLQQILERQGYFRVPDGVSLVAPDERWRLWDRFDFQEFCSSAGGEKIHAFLGDGQGLTWIYPTRAGQDPCLECLVRRWIANSFLGKAGEELCQPGRQVAWEACLTQADCQDYLQKGVRWGQVAWKEKDQREWQYLPVLPVPLCRRCSHLGVQCPQASIYDPRWGLLPRQGLWKDLPEGFWLESATPGESLWLTGDPGYPGGTGASSCSQEESRLRAMGEAVERYCASFVAIPGRPEICLTFGSGSLSHGLACGADLESARQSAYREKVERDATAVFWGRLTSGVATGALRLEEIPWSPGDLDVVLLSVPSSAQPVYVCALRDGQGRVACGAACQFSLKAVEEAFHNYEFLQRHGDRPLQSKLPQTFEEHLCYYWQHPRHFPWKRVLAISSNSAVESLGGPLAVEFFELTTCDVRAVGLRVVRALAPEALFLPASHDDWPCQTARWKELVGKRKPPIPHPFG